jgi:hypothetical protein
MHRRIDEAATPAPEPEPTPDSTQASLPRQLATTADLEAVIQQLQALRADLEAGKSVSLHFKP